MTTGEARLLDAGHLRSLLETLGGFGDGRPAAEVTAHIAALERQLVAARAAMLSEIAELERYTSNSTHWEGCATAHRACMAIRRLRDALPGEAA